jgi:hypothetical protein
MQDFRRRPTSSTLDLWDDEEEDTAATDVERTVNIRRLSMREIDNSMSAAAFVSAMTALDDGDAVVQVRSEHTASLCVDSHIHHTLELAGCRSAREETLSSHGREASASGA